MPIDYKNRISNDAYNKLLNFVKQSTKDFDSSHNDEHAVNVKNNTLDIANNCEDIFDEDLLVYMAMLHDVRDHKYPNKSISLDTLLNFIDDAVGIEKRKLIMKVIDNVSFSKEDKGLRERFDNNSALYKYLTIISDADRLEAIGKIGIDRCIQYTIQIGGKVPEDVVQHCHEKLLRLYNENFIKTEYARKKALPLHNDIIKYVEENK